LRQEPGYLCAPRAVAPGLEPAPRAAVDAVRLQRLGSARSSPGGDGADPGRAVSRHAVAGLGTLRPLGAGAARVLPLPVRAAGRVVLVRALRRATHPGADSGRRWLPFATAQVVAARGGGAIQRWLGL